MQSDDVYPNDGAFLGGVPLEPLDQVVARKKERAQAMEAASVIENIIQHFAERIDYRSNLDAIKPDLAKDPALHQKVCEVNAMLKLALIEEKGLLEELLSMHAKR